MPWRGFLPWRALLLFLTLVTLLPGCASGGSGTAEGVYGSDTAETAVRQFLDAARREDYRAMSRVFGTKEGPAERRFGRAEVEQRMFVLASFLQHDSYSLRPAKLPEGPGRVRFLADMTGTRNGDVSVPIVAVQHRDRWFVEQVITESLTRPSGR